MSTTFKAEVTGFKPSKQGFNFVNSFQLKDFPLGDKIASKINQSGYGLCGGMAHCVNELFIYNEAVPSNTTPPKPNTPLYHYIAGGLLDSFGKGLRDMKKILDWYAMPDGKVKLPKLTKIQLIGLKLLLSRGKLVQLMISYNTEGQGKEWDNHQVLAYKVEETNGSGTIWLYEPNNPNCDTARIEYTVDANGVHMIEKDGSKGNATPKVVHGFFVVLPRIENPLTLPTYLLHKGHAFFVDRMRNNLRKSIYEIAQDLKKYTDLKPAEILKLLKNSGYNATDVARVCKDVLLTSAEIALNLLRQVGFSVGQIIAALHIVFRRIASWLLREMLKIGYKLADIALGLQSHFRMKLVDLIKTLKAQAQKLNDIVKILIEKFRITAKRTLAKMLREAKYAVSDIIGALKKVGLSIKDAIIIMRRDFEWSVVAAARIAKQHFGNKPKEILLALWQHGNASISELISTAKSAFNWSRKQLMGIV